MNKIIKKKIKELEVRISEDRIIKNKDRYICKFCKEHPDDCFCNDHAKLELKGINFVLKKLKK